MAIDYTAKEYVDDQTSPWPISGPNLTEDNETLGEAVALLNGASSTPVNNALMTWPANASGTFTPYLTFGGATTGITYSSQVGFWQRIGNFIKIVGRIGLSSIGTSTGTVVLNGLPAMAYATSVTPLTLFHGTITYSGTIVAYIIGGTTTANIQQTTEAGTKTSLTNSNFSNSSELWFSAEYYAPL